MDIAAGMLTFVKSIPKQSVKSLDHSWLVGEITETVLQMKAVESMYNTAENEDIIDFCIYTLKALEAKYRYLHRLAKLQQVSVDEAQ